MLSFVQRVGVLGSRNSSCHLLLRNLSTGGSIDPTHILSRGDRIASGLSAVGRFGFLDSARLGAVEGLRLLDACLRLRPASPARAGEFHRRFRAAGRVAASHRPLRSPRLRWILTDVRSGCSGRGRPEGVIPNTYVPARNTIFLSFALAYAEVRDAEAIVLGINALDYSGYPDCRPEYLEAMSRVARLATRQGVEGRPPQLLAPLIELSKAEIVRLGSDLGVPWELTWSCYLGGDLACGVCDSCRLRLKGFEEAGMQDPVEYGPQPGPLSGGEGSKRC